jgi:hypothetical protein
MEEEVTHLMAARKQREGGREKEREREREQVPISSSRAHPQLPNFLPLCPTF